MLINGYILFIGKTRRLTLMECNNDINSMIDLAKVADLVSIKSRISTDITENLMQKLYRNHSQYQGITLKAE